MLSLKEREIFFATELDAELSAPEIAKKSGNRVSTVQQVLKRLIDRKIILGRTAIVDLSRLGLFEFGLRLQVELSSRVTREKVEQILVSVPEVSWLASIGGTYSYLANIIAANPNEAHSILHHLRQKIGTQIVRQDLCIRTERYRLWERMQPREKTRVRFHIGGSAEVEQLSAKDSEVLNALDTIGFKSYRDVARAIGMPTTTLMRHISSLRDQGIFLGLGFRLHRELAGFSQFRLFIRTTHASAEITKAILNIMQRHPATRLLALCLGPWDYEIALDISFSQELQEFTDDIAETLDKKLISIESVPVFKQNKLISFPASTISVVSTVATRSSSKRQECNVKG